MATYRKVLYKGIRKDRLHPVRGLRGLTFLLLAAAMCATPAAAYDLTKPLNFGPVGGDRQDRSFVKEWEGNPPPGFPTLSPANIKATEAAIRRYQSIVDAGGWGSLPQLPRRAVLQAGQSDRAVSELRQRLSVSGDMEESGFFDEYFDGTLEKGVKRFQASNGLTPTGIVDQRTIAALNVPADVRLDQLKKNISRLKQYGGLGKGKYVVVNIPAVQVEAIENNRVVSRHAAVVGKPDRATPLLRTRIHQMNFNPVWRLPPTVVKEDLIPKGREMQAAGQDVLVKYGIDAHRGGKKVDPDAIDWSSSEPHSLSFSQQPGKENPLGFLKINFNNSHSVYMHDTPSDTLFGRNFRAASSGCIRVAYIEQLAIWLLEGRSGWSKGRVDYVKEKGQRIDVSLSRQVPLYFVYITAWATEDGVVQFRRDLYERDGIGEIATSY